MTPEAQRIAIAEACGIRCKVNPFSGNVLRLVPAPAGETGMRFGQPVPNYLADLNAMHEAEKRLTPEQWYGWFDLIGRVVGYTTPVPPADYTERILIQRATAAQRAEAFLRTLNLWRE